MMKAIALDRFGGPDVLSIRVSRRPCELSTRARRRWFRLCRRGTHKPPFDKAPEGYRHFDARDKGWTNVVLKAAGMAA
jgi:hypothetical protein